MEKEYTRQLMVPSMMENGLMGNTMELGLFNGLMAVFTRASGRTAEKMARVNFKESMEPYTKESGLMASTTEREN